MIRKSIISAVTVFALMFSVLSLSADAQTVTPTPTPVQCSTPGYNGCIAYPAGGFGSSAAATPTPRPTPAPTSSAVVSADTVAATGTGSGEASIAFTGSESRVLGYVGAGLIGFGAIALATARRKSEADLD